jgi:4-carboxymuconolactone decarboxylase
LEAHSMAALNVGVTPLELREAIYQCAPFIGFPRTLNAVATINKVFTQRGITLPLEQQGTVNEENRHQKGADIQYPLYGDEIKEAMKSLPERMNKAVPDFLTEMCFGDFYTRGTLDVKTREMLMLCVLTTLGANNQIKAHTIGNLKAGNSKETLYSAIIQCLPYIGFPFALNAINIIKTTEEQ